MARLSSFLGAGRSWALQKQSTEPRVDCALNGRKTWQGREPHPLRELQRVGRRGNYGVVSGVNQPRGLRLGRGLSFKRLVRSSDGRACGNGALELHWIGTLHS